MHALTDIRRMPVPVETRRNENCDLVNVLAPYYCGGFGLAGAGFSLDGGTILLIRM
jgi:hypothetical protein